MKTSLSFLLIAALLSGCNHSNLFSPNDDEKNREAAGQITIAMHISGGFAGVSRQLLIDNKRYARYADVQAPLRQIEVALAAEEYNKLIALFIEKDFLHMRPSYIDSRVADAFLYRILFRHGGAEKQVETDYISAPTDLRILVDKLLGVAETLKNHSLSLEFKTSAETLRHGEKLTLTLVAANRGTSPLALEFRGQVFDFFATTPAAIVNSFPPTSFLWSWAYDKVFIQLVWSETLQPGESRAYSAEWDGRSNKGELLAGEFLLGARLASYPGGYTQLRRVVVMP